MKNFQIAAMCFVALSFFMPLAQGQCPGAIDPVQLIAGQTWAFQTQTGEHGQASIGTFTASVKSGQGVLVINETISSNGVITRLAAASGRYLINADCKGGTLFFNWNGQAVQLEVVFMSNFTEMYIVTLSNIPFNYTLWGTAKLGGVTQCPVGNINPLDVLNGTNWAFKTYPGYYLTNIGPSIGTLNLFEGLDRAGKTIGVVNLTETIKNFFQAPIRLSADQGRYLVNENCSGGTLFLNNSYRPIQYEFVFVDGALTEMYLLAIGPNYELAGHAKRF